MKLSTVILVFSLSITPTLTKGVTIAQWTFESSVPATAGPIAPETGIGEGTSYHANNSVVFSNPYGNGSPESWSANYWSVGDYWQFSVNLTSFQGISLAWDQASSNTGPGVFGLFWSKDGSTFSEIGGDFGVLPNASPNPQWNSSSAHPEYSFSRDLSSIANLNNSATVYFRLVDGSTTSADGGTVAGGGTDRIDNFTVSGTPVLVGVPDSLPLYFAAAALFGLLIFARRLWLAAPGRMPN